MANKNKSVDQIRNAVTAEYIRQISHPGFEQKILKETHLKTDVQLDRDAWMMEVPPHQYKIYRDLMRGKDNEFHLKLSSFQDQLKIGDIILVTGTAISSKLLADSQRIFYKNAKSSHVVVVHAEFMCIDAIPGTGVSNRTIIEVLHNVEASWRVIRLKSLNDIQRAEMMKRSAYYLQQPYMIKMNKKTLKNHSYCSELARKIYVDCNIPNTYIPKSAVVKPCDFDKLADLALHWEDVTEKVRPFIEFSIEYKAFVTILSKMFVNGLKLNKSRSDERGEWVRNIKRAGKKGQISIETSKELVAKIKQADAEMSYQFWNSEVNPPK